MTLNQLGMACAANARDLLPPFRAVVAGKPGNQIIQLTQEAAQAKAAAAKPAGERA